LAIKFRDDIDLDGAEILNANLGSIEQHSDVDLTGIGIGDTLVWNGSTFEPGAGGGGGGTLQDAYDGGNEIEVVSGSPVQILAPSVTEYFDPGFATFVLDGSHIHFHGDNGRIAFYQINSDVAWTAVSATEIDFGAGINLVTQGHDVPGITVSGANSFVFLKTSDVAADRGIYVIIGVSNGLGTNSVATLFNVAGPTAIAGTGGLVSSGNRVSYFDGKESAYITSSHVDVPTVNLTVANDGGSVVSLALIQNTKVGVSSGTAVSTSLLDVINSDTTGTSNVPLIRLSQSADSPHIRFTGTLTDPTAPSGGSFWYNTSSGILKYHNGTTTVALTGGGGGSGPTLFDAIVPTDYATISAAVAAGETHIRVISNVTETANTSLTSGESYLFWIDEGVAVTFNSTVRFIYTGNTQVILRGGGTLNWTLTTTGQALFDNSSFGGSLFDSDGVKFLNNSTIASTPLTWCNQRIRNFVMNCGLGGIRAFATVAGVEEFYLESGEIVGASAATNQVISLGAPSIQCYISNVRFTGTFAASASYLFDITGPVTMRDIIYEGTTAQCRIQGNVTIDGFLLRGTADFDFDIRSSYNKFSNCNQTSTGDLTLDMDTAGDYNTFNSINCDSLGLTGVVSDNNKFSNCRVETAVQINSHRNSFVNCDFLASLGVDGDNNRFVNCQIGPDGGGGTDTINISAVADGTTVVSCYTDAAIVDGGTNTQLVANTVY
jgi:hypothetical protein